MSKILISPLGAGALKKDSIESIGRYRKATYKIAGEEYETSFVASALYKHLELDDIIFIGTVKSMWEEVYFSFCSEKGIMIDEDYWEELSKIIFLLFCCVNSPWIADLGRCLYVQIAVFA